uniref:Sugar transferase n=1 Tax=Solibacter usitatus (strain Ellin6076) TaxID=234267 RepID=Q01S13_SOLUE
MGSLPVIRQTAAGTEWTWQTVALVERAAAMILLLLALPVLVICALVLCLLSRRSPLIAHRRVGWQGAPLWMLKLRTMWDADTPHEGWIEHIDDDHGPALKSENDARVSSAFARFCRRHSVDELPQLWHVLSGEMSLVGPRPVTRYELDRYYGTHAEEILQARPGLAGLWQVSGRNRLSYAERCSLDLRLVRERNIPLYCTILLRTLPEVLRGRNSW